jgi:D-glycero-alpha-D-manno-heptose-7-phosphate kinase
MIITRTPLRISLGGGGTDLPSYFASSDGGFLVAAAISKYVYVAIHPNFGSHVLLKYSSIENVPSAADVKHPLIREALLYAGIDGGVEISSLADIPAGTGLGSSGTFTVGLLRAIYAYQRRYVSSVDVAAHACHIEIDRLGDPVGKQDQYIAAIGGVTAFEILPDGQVIPESVAIPQPARERFEENLMLFYTGIRRSAATELRELHLGAAGGDRDMHANLDEVKASGLATKAALEAGDLSAFAALLTDQWKLKYKRSPSTIHDQVDGWLQEGLDHGGMGGKLVGAGGGGFLLFYAEHKADLRARMTELGLEEVTFSIDHQGATVIVQ